MGQPVAEQNRVELVGLAVDVEISAREVGVEQRGAETGHKSKQLLDISVLGASKGERIEPGSGEKGLRVDAAAMGRIEDERHLKALRPRHGEGWRQLGLDRFNLAWAHSCSCRQVRPDAA
jgi:hypothetical protein